MKRIVAVIKPFKLDYVIAALNEIGIHSLTVSEVKGFGTQRENPECYKDSRDFDFVPKVMITTVVDETRLENAVKTIAREARTGKPGDGIVWVSHVEEMIKIRTGKIRK